MLLASFHINSSIYKTGSRFSFDLSNSLFSNFIIYILNDRVIFKKVKCFLDNCMYFYHTKFHSKRITCSGAMALRFFSKYWGANYAYYVVRPNSIFCCK